MCGVWCHFILYSLHWIIAFRIEMTATSSSLNQSHCTRISFTDETVRSKIAIELLECKTCTSNHKMIDVSIKKVWIQWLIFDQIKKWPVLDANKSVNRKTLRFLIDERKNSRLVDYINYNLPMKCNGRDGQYNVTILIKIHQKWADRNSFDFWLPLRFGSVGRSNNGSI